MAGGAVIARQGIESGGSTETVAWEHTAPGGFTVRNTGTDNSETNSTEERDALGNNMGVLPAPTVVNKTAISGGNSDPMTSTDSGEQEIDGILMPGSMISPTSLRAKHTFWNDEDKDIDTGSNLIVGK